MSSAVPEGWASTTIGEAISEIADGGTPATSNAEYFNGSIPWIVIDDIQPRIVHTKSSITELGLQKSSAKLWDEGTIILSTGATIGEVGIAMKAMATKQGICGVVVKSHVSAKYFYHLLVSKKRQLNILSQGSTIKETRPPIVKKIQICLPPLPEQKKIASILTSVDEVIENTQKQIDKLQDLKKATMNELLTKGIGHTEFKDSELGQIPKEWKIFTLGELTKISSSNVDKKIREEDQKVKLCNYMDVYSNNYIRGYLDFMDSTASVKEVEKFIVKKGNIIITKDSESPDDIAVPALVVDDIANLICGYHLYLITTKKVLDAGYLMNYLLLDSTKISIGKVAQGSTRFGINLSEVKSLNIPLPSLSEQKSISTKIFSKDNLIEGNKNILEKYKSLKKSLMQDLLTGKVRVSVN